ncbi:ABC transporter permease [Flavobacterium sp. MAH-1]|uniref:ABC transporter permease n=1 Tax=Flavobacterium agri TaxID=2743471 RepID=A0A7Y8Y2R1_9FLAO|nr:ABC transporter permease [Flavobacterium agri]NUY81382.1 ABC transporter permease [Flavobacterium agri]NYA71406.1 ABC transporter permease [Flavobacterium agri]
MHKLRMSIQKELLLLRRDIGGVVILFAMPLVLILAVTLIQNAAYQRSGDSQIPILIVDNDKGDVAKSVFENMKDSHAFDLVTEIDGKPITETSAKNAVFSGKYQLAIVIPENLSSDLQAKIDQNVEKILLSFGLADSLKPKVAERIITKKDVKLYFDPAVQMSFKNAVMNNIDKMISKIESQSIYAAFKEQLGDEAGTDPFENQNFIAFKEINPTVGNKEIKPNAVQHNVPAWTLFAMFFIVIPLSINMVKEKNQGTFIRLRTNPVSSAVVIGGKTLTYLIICMIQFYMMIAVGIWIFPLLGLPALNVDANLFMLTVVALFSGLAATGYGILVGTIAKTQEQSAPFGATSVIILAAIGGVWVPVFAMPKFMQYVAMCSPMNWGLDAFYDVFLRNASIMEIYPEIALLFLFFVVTITIALLYDKKKRSV